MRTPTISHLRASVSHRDAKQRRLKLERKCWGLDNNTRGEISNKDGKTNIERVGLKCQKGPQKHVGGLFQRLG